MLKEGWDVKNVTVILGLRPFTAKANILPEQAVGRGLRLMKGLGDEDNQILELIGTPAFEEFVKQLEEEGVGIAVTKTPPKPGVYIYPIKERKNLDIVIPKTSPSYRREYKELSKLDINDFKPIIDETKLDVSLRKKIDLIHGTIKVKVAQDEIIFNEDNTPPAQAFLSEITDRIKKQAKLVCNFNDLYPKVRNYVKYICFGKEVDLQDVSVRKNLSYGEIQDAISNLFTKKINELTTVKQDINLEADCYKLSEVEPFLWRRNAISVTKSIFNAAACYNLSLEGAFVQFLDNVCDDVVRFAKLAEWFTGFHIDYLSSSGGTKFYYPDFVVVQKIGDKEKYWIVETKGREFDDVIIKDNHMKRWCEEVSQKSGQSWNYIKIPQSTFLERKYTSFQGLVDRLKIVQQTLL